MPIRIEKDPERRSGGRDNYPGRRSKGGGGGGNPIIYFLPAILKMFGRNPKLLLLVAVIAVIFYFFGGGNCNLPVEQEESAVALATGCDFDPAKYDATEIYEPLADNKRNPLPERMSLLNYAPKRLNQGKQGSCVGWASAYAARTILYARETGRDPNSSAFSPAYLYNQIALSGCQGSYLPDAMKSMQNGGVAPFSVFGYDDSSCSEKPDREDKQIAQSYTIDGFNRLTQGDDQSAVDMLAIKQNLAQGAPVVIGMMVGGSFMKDMRGEPFWYPTASDYDQRGFGGHAMCVIGYDDYLEGGSFQIMNSWGEDWGEKGVFWIRYKDFDYFTREAYGLYPMGDADQPKGRVNELEIGLVVAEGTKPVSLQSNGSELYTTKLAKGERFKIEVTNSLPCYVYVFGQDTDKSSYVLFPYTPKHSPYCGVTGTRVFPNDHSLYPDDQGSEDVFAIVFSNEVLDYDEWNSKINAQGSQGLAQALLNLSSGFGDISAGERASMSMNLDSGPKSVVVKVIK